MPCSGDTPLDLLLGKHGERGNFILVLRNNMIGKKFSITALYSCTSWEESLAVFVLGYTSKEVCRMVLKDKDNVLCQRTGLFPDQSNKGTFSLLGKVWTESFLRASNRLQTIISSFPL